MEIKQGRCSLCEKEVLQKQSKTLYNSIVCPKCYYGFANRRQLAFLIDFLIFRVILFFLMFAYGALLATIKSIEIPINQSRLFFEIIMWPIFLIKDGFDGQSIGKKLMGVTVIREDKGDSADFPDSFKRNLPLLIPFMFLIIACRLEKGKRIGDGWAKTKVIWNKYKNQELFRV